MQRNNPLALACTHRWIAALMARSGRLAEAEEHFRQAQRVSELAGRARQYYGAALGLCALNVMVRGDAERGLRVVDEALERFPLDSMPPLDRRYLDLTYFLAEADRPERARAMLEAYEREIDPRLRRRGEAEVHDVRGMIALAESAWPACTSSAAIRSARSTTTGSWCRCGRAPTRSCSRGSRRLGVRFGCFPPIADRSWRVSPEFVVFCFNSSEA
jgi:tetratricopeptide (TPR) repeat protein